MQQQSAPDAVQLDWPSSDTRPCVCYVLSYRDPNYIRTRSLLRALEMCDGIRVVFAMNRHRGFRRYFETLRSLWQIRSVEKPDAYILGFRGHEIFWLVRRVVGKKPLILDAMMSPYEALREEGKVGTLGYILAPFVHHMERYALVRAQAVLTDTRLHVAYYERVFGIPAEKVIAVPVGAVELCPDVEPKQDVCSDDEFTALFYGSFLALHGIDVIVQAAAKLKDLPIRFDFVGGRATQARRLRRQCRRLGVTRYTHRYWIPFSRLVDNEIPRATVCLGGPFGDTPQARRVVTGKTSQCLAQGRPTVVGKIDEDHGFMDRVNCLLVDQGDPVALARALRWAYENRSSLEQIGLRGRDLYNERLSVRRIAEQMPALLRKVGVNLSSSES